MSRGDTEHLSAVEMYVDPDPNSNHDHDTDTGSSNSSTPDMLTHLKTLSKSKGVKQPHTTDTDTVTSKPGMSIAGYACILYSTLSLALSVGVCMYVFVTVCI